MNDITITSEIIGRVISVNIDEGYFSTTIADKRDFDKVEALSIPINAVSPSDIHNIKKGAMFEILVGYETNKNERTQSIFNIQFINNIEKPTVQ